MASDPFRYFRIEAEELLGHLSRGVLQLERGNDPDVLSKLLRYAHTFKGASRVVKQLAIAETAHAIEDLLAPLRNPECQVERATIDGALAMVDKLRALVAALPDAKQPERKSSTASDALKAVWVDVAELDKLNDGIREASASVSLCLRLLEPLSEAASDAAGLYRVLSSEKSSGPRLQSKLDRLLSVIEATQRGLVQANAGAAKELSELAEIASELRLVPAETLLTELERAARDAAQTLGKQVEFSSEGKETRLEAPVLSELRAALRHAIGNAVAHGIEDPKTRIALGKSPAGRITIQIERRGRRVFIACRDDGRGIDLDAVRRSAVARELLKAERAGSASSEELMELLLKGGVSTSERVTELAGRGVGLSVALEAARRLKGEVKLSTERGRGTSLELSLPTGAAFMAALGLFSNGSSLLFPLESVAQTLRIDERGIFKDANGEQVVVDGQLLPFISSRSLLGSQPTGETEQKTQSCVVVSAANGRAALGVDKLGSIRRVVVRSLPNYLRLRPIVDGVALSEEGVPEMVLAPAAVVEAARASRPSKVTVERAKRLPVLVVDDSLTTRMLEQNILESAGYEVDLAVSAEEALGKARERRYGLFIVDVEMPGMSGFEFVDLTRRDVELRQTPAILVTSRNDAADKARGKNVGAQAYIVKGEFDQRRLLDTVKSWVG